jgi:hypothetical protein
MADWAPNQQLLEQVVQLLRRTEQPSAPDKAKHLQVSLDQLKNDRKAEKPMTQDEALEALKAWRTKRKEISECTSLR